MKAGGHCVGEKADQQKKVRAAESRGVVWS